MPVSLCLLDVSTLAGHPQFRGPSTRAVGQSDVQVSAKSASGIRKCLGALVLARVVRPQEDNSGPERLDCLLARSRTRLDDPESHLGSAAADTWAQADDYLKTVEERDF